MISGGPGTGKTVVALHRAAYLLYSHRRRFESGGVLVVGPSRVFMNYIERVLPSLGEDAVTLRSIGGRRLRRGAASRGERVDDAGRGGDQGQPADGHGAAPAGVRAAAGRAAELRLTVKGDVLRLRRRVLAGIRSDVLAHHKLNLGREAAERALLAALWRVRPDDLDLERDDFEDLVTDTPSFERFCNAWWPPVSAAEALSRLAGRRAAPRGCPPASCPTPSATC